MPWRAFVDVRAKNEWNGPGFTDTHFTVDRAHTGLPETKVRGYTNRFYSRLAGRGSVNHNKRRVIHTTARPVALAPGDILKIGMDNYFLGNNAPDGSFQLLGSRVGASVLSHGFQGRVKRARRLLCYRHGFQGRVLPARICFCSLREVEKARKLTQYTLLPI